MILLELLGIDAAPGRSKYHRTGKPTGRPHEMKLKPRPNKNLWFNNDKLWHEDVYLTHNGNFDLVSDENEEQVIACDKDHRVAFGKWDKKKGRGITFKKPRPIHIVIHPKTKLKENSIPKTSFKTFLVESNKKQEFVAKNMGNKLMNAARNDISARNVAHDPLEIVQALAKLDPQNGKNLLFLATKYANGQFRLEDAERVKNALTQFQQIKKNLPSQDINQFKSIHDLYDAVESEEPTPSQSKRQQKQKLKQEGTEVVIKGPGIIILRLLTEQAACYYAAGTKWCTSNEDTFMSYARKGDIYVIMVKDQNGNTRKFQFHYSSNQIMDEKDRELSQSDIKLLSSFPEWYQFVDMMVKKHHSELR